MVFAIHQILLGWKTYKYYNETDELPNPRPTQPKKNYIKSGVWATFPTTNIFSWVGIDFIWEADYKKPNPTKFSANTLLVGWLVSWYLLGWLVVGRSVGRSVRRSVGRLIGGLADWLADLLIY